VQNTGLAPIAIIGGGASGAAAVLHLAREAFARPIMLFERGLSIGRGLAYSTRHPQHWLNVAAARMSIYADKPDHFLNWCIRSKAVNSPACAETPIGVFANRMLYGAYIEEEVMRAAGARDTLSLVNDEVVDIERRHGGYELMCASGRTHSVGGVVLALGHPRRGKGGAGGAFEGADPWSFDPQSARSDQPVVIVGTGLTMVDVAISLASSGLAAPILAISRRGLLPRAHASKTERAAPRVTPHDGRSALGLLRRVRREIERGRHDGACWRSVIDSYRPVTQEIWQSMPAAARSQFLRHLRPWWDVHRHRLAPGAVEQVQQLIGKGQLQVAAGRIVAVEERNGEISVTWRPRGSPATRTIAAQTVIDATGIDGAGDGSEPLRARMSERGLTRPGPMGLGIDVTRDLRVLDRNGDPHRRLWALGPITRGVFWECIAVPDIRVQAANLAAHVMAEMSPQAVGS